MGLIFLLTEYDPSMPTGTTPAPIQPDPIQPASVQPATIQSAPTTVPLQEFTTTLLNSSAVPLVFQYPPLNKVPVVIPQYALPTHLLQSQPTHSLNQNPPTAPPDIQTLPPDQQTLSTPNEDVPDLADKEVAQIDTYVCKQHTHTFTHLHTTYNLN